MQEPMEVLDSEYSKLKGRKDSAHDSDLQPMLFMVEKLDIPGSGSQVHFCSGGEAATAATARTMCK